jgi:subfamily B ATP-binding cassette protein MsbA
MLNKISWKLSIIACLLIPFNMAISKLYEKANKIVMKGYEELNKSVGTYIHETISHISIMKTYAVEDIAMKKHNMMSDKQLGYIFRQTLLYGANLLLISNLPTLTTIGIIMAAKYLNNTEGLVSFILHNQSLYENVMAIIQYNNEFIKCKEPYKRITELLDSDKKNKGYYIPQDNTLKGKIEFVDVSFKYEKSEGNLINNFNFKINPGEKIAIIGNSGSGKSTIVKCLMGILSLNGGNIYIDDIDSNLYDNKWLKERIGYVAQDSILFSDTIANNIAYGQQQIDQARLWQAIEQANAKEFISQLPQSVDTLIGENGFSLSGGQRQRLALARAIYKNAPILILDEATAALDNQTELMIQQSLETFHHQRTQIIIAHRLSTIQFADKIFVMQAGKIIEAGNHQELLALQGHYANLYHAQVQPNLKHHAETNILV